MPATGRGDLLSLGDGLVDIGREEQVSSSGLLDDLIESWLVDWESVRVPGIDSGLIEIDDGDSDVWAGTSAYASGPGRT
jgi:hypothetical protein